MRVSHKSDLVHLVKFIMVDRSMDSTLLSLHKPVRDCTYSPHFMRTCYIIMHHSTPSSKLPETGVTTSK